MLENHDWQLMRKNRDLWDEMVPIHRNSDFYSVDQFIAGENKLNPLALGEVGSVDGKNLLHLQCHFGLDTLSWARLGAHVTGVDYSEKAVEAAADLAFLEQNVPAAFTDALDGLERISTIVQAMKEFGNADRQEKSLIDLNQALQVTLTIARTEYAPVADIETDFQPLPPVMCHQGDMNQVFLNLLVNAAHAIAEMVGQGGRKGVIRLRTAHEGRWVRIDIQDTGCGIAPEIQERLFEPFFTTKEVGRGSGQGLAIAYSLVVDKHGGSLSFASEVGRGTTFTIRLPVAAPVLPAAEGQNVLQSAASASAAPA